MKVSWDGRIERTTRQPHMSEDCPWVFENILRPKLLSPRLSTDGTVFGFSYEFRTGRYTRTEVQGVVEALIRHLQQI